MKQSETQNGCMQKKSYNMRAEDLATHVEKLQNLNKF